MRLDRAGYPFIAGTLIPAALLLARRRTGLGLPLLGLAGFMTFFFRDPERYPPQHPDIVVAPADGQVVYAGPGERGVAPAGDWQQASIFLSRIARTPGRFLPAYDDRAAAENERTEMWVRRGDRTVVSRQVVGVLARRIVCRAQVGDEVVTGERYGVMKFGSRMDVFVPRDCRLLVRTGDRVRGGESVIARWS
jgi:phosphatidylserine decarboxylase